MDLDNNVDISVDISANIIDDNVKLNIQEVSGNTVAIISNALENFDKLRMTYNNQSTTISSPINTTSSFSIKLLKDSLILVINLFEVGIKSEYLISLLSIFCSK